MTVLLDRWKRRIAIDLESLLSERQLASLFVAPALLVMAVLIGWPIVYALFLSFQTLTVSSGEINYQFVGLSNYLRFLEDTRLQQTIVQTVTYTFFRVAGAVGLGLGLAMLLNQVFWGVGLLKRLFLIPWALSNVVNALVWGWIFNGNFGVVNAMLLMVGAIDQYHVWFAEPATAMLAIVFADVWKAVPFAALMLMASLQGLPRDLEDAAKVDGANAWNRFRYILIPWMRPVLLVLLVMETMWAFKAFDLIWVLTKGGPLDRTMVLNVYAYQQTFSFFNFGYGASVAYFITLLILGLTVLYFVALRGFEE
jgi:ABC-type sugar transport system permease subunit